MAAQVLRQWEVKVYGRTPQYVSADAINDTDTLWLKLTIDGRTVSIYQADMIEWITELPSLIVQGKVAKALAADQDIHRVLRLNDGERSTSHQAVVTPR